MQFGELLLVRLLKEDFVRLVKNDQLHLAEVHLLAARNSIGNPVGSSDYDVSTLGGIVDVTDAARDLRPAAHSRDHLLDLTNEFTSMRQNDDLQGVHFGVDLHDRRQTE